MKERGTGVFVAEVTVFLVNAASVFVCVCVCVCVCGAGVLIRVIHFSTEC